MTGDAGTWPRRLGWFALLWLGGLAVVGSVAFLIRLWLLG